MELRQFVNQSILNYPTLYRDINYKLSRLAVLNHVFLGYGTGLEWHKDGYLYHLPAGCSTEQQCTESVEIPDDYFDIELFEMMVPIDQFEEVVSKLKTDNIRVFRYKPNDNNWYTDVVFQSSDESTAKQIALKYGINPYTSTRPPICHSASRIDRLELWRSRFPTFSNEIIPGDICPYSPIVEMTVGKTNSPHIDNFEFVTFKSDWLEGAVDVVIWAWDFYCRTDAERLKQITTPHINIDIDTLNKYIERQKDFLREFLKKFSPWSLGQTSK